MLAVSAILLFRVNPSFVDERIDGSPGSSTSTARRSFISGRPVRTGVPSALVTSAGPPFNDADPQVSGRCRTVRGPSMSTTAGKVLVEGVIELFGKDLFVLEFLLARQPERVEGPASGSRAGGFFFAADAGVDED